MTGTVAAAVLDRIVSTPWGVFEIRPPTVREALTVIAASEGDDFDVAAFMSVAGAWLPRRLVRAIKKTKDWRGASVWAGALMKQGTEGLRRPRKSDKPVVNLDDWDDVLADFCACYGVLPSAVLNEPWPLFLIMAAKVPQVQARDQVRTIRVRSLPYMKDSDEQAAVLDSIRATANQPHIDPEWEKAEKDRIAKEQWVRKRKMWMGARRGGNSHTNP